MEFTLPRSSRTKRYRPSTPCGKYLASFGHKPNLVVAGALGVQVTALEGDDLDYCGRQFIGSDILGTHLGVHFPRSGIFVLAEHLTRNNLPFSIPIRPCVRSVIPGTHVLTENCFGFVEVVAQDRCVVPDMALCFHKLDAAGVACRKRGDVIDQSCLSMHRPFSSK